MSIATEIERLQQAKTDIKTAIENKGVNVGNGTIDTFAEKIGEISAGGGENYLLYANSVQFANPNLFNKKVVTLDLPMATDYTKMFAVSVQNTTIEHLIVNGRTDGTITNATSAFEAATTSPNLKRLTLNCDFSKSTSMAYFISRWSQLEIVDGIPIDFSGTTTGIQTLNLAKLVEMRIAPVSIKAKIGFYYSPNLSDETIQSIIDGLADLTGQTAQTITLHADVKSKLTDTQLTTITSKNWNLA